MDRNHQKPERTPLCGVLSGFIYALLLENRSSKSSIQISSLALFCLVIFFYSLMIFQIHCDKSDAKSENQPRHTETH